MPGGYPWSQGDLLLANDLNAAIANAGADYVSVSTFGAVGDGVTDDTAALQAAVNSVASRGGRVHIGNLRLRISGNVTVPEQVRLSGDFRHVAVSNYNPGQDWYAWGSQICLGPSGTISIGSSQCDHIMFIRAGLYTTLPANATDAAAIVANFGGTAITSSGNDTLIEACMFLGFATAINAPASSRLNVIDCLFDCTNGIYNAGSGDICRFERCHFWPLMTMLIPGVGPGPANPAPMKRAGYAMQLHGGWPQIINCFQFGYNNGFWLVDNSVGTFIATHSDYPADNTGLVAGFQFTGGCSYCKMYGCWAMTPVVINVSGGTADPAVEVIGGTFVNGGINVIAGSALVNGATFENCNPAINYGSGTLNGNVVGCNFDRCPTTVAFASGAVRALVAVVGNVGLHGSPVTSASLIGNLVSASGSNPTIVAYDTTQNVGAGLLMSAGNLLYVFTSDAAGTYVSARGYWDGSGNYHGSGSVQCTGSLGVNGTTPPIKPTVTGAKGGNVALGSLLSALASYGLITDSSTA